MLWFHLNSSQFLPMAAIGLAAAVLAGSVWPNKLLAQAEKPEPETTTPIKHFIFLMQENHSFDNYFGTYPGADGFPPDVCIPVDPTDPANNECIKPFLMGSNEVENADPDHSEETHRLQYNNGKMDGFVYALNQRNQDGRIAMGYYDDSVLSYYWNIADEYVLFDRFFSSAAGGSQVNHIFWIAAVPGTVSQGQTLQSVLAETPTIFDRLQEAGVSWKFYVQNYEPDLTYRTVHLYPGNRAAQVIWVPLLNIDRFLDNEELFSRIVDLEEYRTDLINGTLPQVAFMVPSGPSEHPPSSLQSGQAFVKTLIQALMSSNYWESSAFFWAYDDWGGWYDHVPPPQVDEHGYGFRVPALLVSSYAKRGHIEHTTFDYTSVLRFIEDNWNIEPMATRDAQATSIISAFDFNQPPRRPAFVSYTRDEGVTKAEPRRSVIYLLYSGGIGLAALTMIMAVVLSRGSKSPRRLMERNIGVHHGES